ncbi:SPRY domain-containing protein 3-like [Ruditapes philippinarum]|uniref:SPRY domain-containing protein 3-like n=1 Tax=Ruditapes philippinarum TaxID=129788 RepID=UPI00295B8E51|nr:SPRY domain-containing protein 3-like [Ruditapes philippinarum]
MQPGWGKNSIGYHADDGRLYHESGSGTVFGPKCLVGDKIGCWINGCRVQRGLGVRITVNAVFTRNGKKVGERQFVYGLFHLYPAVGMHSSGEKVKFIFEAKRPGV